MATARPAWYFVSPDSKLRDLLNLLHLPYTAMLLSFVVIGAVAAPETFPDRLLATLVAYFLGLGIGAHAFDQLEPGGSHYVHHLTRRELTALGAGGLLAASGIGLYYAVVLSPYLALFVALGVFFAISYPLPTYVAAGSFHNNLSFSIAWGYLPSLTSYYVNALAITPAAALVCLPMAAAAWAEISLSRSARSARKRGAPPAAYAGKERALTGLVALVCASSLALAALKFA